MSVNESECFSLLSVAHLWRDFRTVDECPNLLHRCKICAALNSHDIQRSADVSSDPSSISQNFGSSGAMTTRVKSAAQ
jgi:hypothetical protein